MPRYIDEDRLFEATVAVFAKNGYRATTTQEIASSAGVNEVTLFRRYGGKAALINAALKHAFAGSPFARVAATDDVTKDITRLVEAYEETTRKYGGAVTTLLTDVARHPELREATAALVPNLLNAASVIAAHQDHGRLTDGDPMQKLVMLIAPLLVSGVWTRAGASAVAPEFNANALVAAFLDGHRAERQGSSPGG
ncbi:TetR/AcrR family transcriptional regulator [Mycobacterium sp. MMS18-G62]